MFTSFIPLVNTISPSRNPQYNPHFTARQKIIRDADKVCRAVNSRFPHISPTYRTREIASNILGLIQESQNGFKNSPLAAKEKYDKYENLVNSYILANNKLEFSRNKRIINNGPVDYFSKLIVYLRKDQLANCAELSELAFLMCKNKNFDDVKIFSLEAFEEFNPNDLNHVNLRECGCNIEDISAIDLDHVAVSFKHNDKTVVVDPWLGVADFVENYKTKIKSLYKNFFIDLKDSHSLRLQPYDQDVEVEQESIKTLSKKFKSLNISF